MSELPVLERKHGVAWVTLSRPDARNALSLAVNRELARLALALDDDPEVRAIVLTGAGDQAFCAGADLKERKGVSAEAAGPYIDAISTAIDAWSRIAKPTICALNGSAYGGGLELALACDLRVCVAGAELGLTEVRLGIMPGAGGTQRLPRLIGVAAAKEMILLGRRIGAARARELGLVMAVVPAAELAGDRRRPARRARRVCAAVGGDGQEGHRPRYRPRHRRRAAPRARVLRRDPVQRGPRRGPARVRREAPTPVHRPLTSRPSWAGLPPGPEPPGALVRCPHRRGQSTSTCPDPTARRRRHAVRGWPDRCFPLLSCRSSRHCCDARGT